MCYCWGGGIGLCICAKYLQKDARKTDESAASENGNQPSRVEDALYSDSYLYGLSKKKSVTV